MIWLRFRAYVTIFITYVQTIVSMLKKLINQREYLEKDPGFLVAINSYVKIFISLFRKLMTYVLIIIDNLIPARKIIHHTLYFSLLPLRVWIHLFQCCRPQYESNMCLFCKNFIQQIGKFVMLLKKINCWCFGLFPVQLTYRVISDGVVNFFVYSSVCDRQKL